MSFEEYFSVEIPNLEAEKILTVKNMVDSVATHKKIIDESQELKKNVETIFQRYLSLYENDSLFSLYHPSDKNFWIDLQKKTDLKIPLPVWDDKTTAGISRIFKWVKWTPDYNWKEISYGRFCEVICFANYEKLVTPNDIKSKYEIYVAIAGITQDKLGIDCYEIFPDKVFTTDFGMD